MTLGVISVHTMLSGSLNQWLHIDIKQEWANCQAPRHPAKQGLWIRPLPSVPTMLGTSSGKKGRESAQLQCNPFPSPIANPGGYHSWWYQRATERLRKAKMCAPLPSCSCYRSSTSVINAIFGQVYKPEIRLKCAYIICFLQVLWSYYTITFRGLRGTLWAWLFACTHFNT